MNDDTPNNVVYATLRQLSEAMGWDHQKGRYWFVRLDRDSHDHPLTPDAWTVDDDPLWLLSRLPEIRRNLKKWGIKPGKHRVPKS